MPIEYMSIIENAQANPSLFTDWSLIIFTVFAQCSMAITVFAGFLLLNDEKNLAISYWKLALFTLIIAFVASIGHLHSPLNALYTITQISHSWLSREIICTGMLLGSLVWLIFIRKWRRCIGLFAAVLSIVYFYVTLRVYTSVIAVPFWAWVPSLCAFLGTSLVLGGAGSLILSNKSEIKYIRLSSLIVLSIGAIFSAAAPFLWLPISVLHNLDIQPYPLFTRYMPALWILHTGLLALGLGLLLCKKLILESSCKYRAWYVFALLCIAELCGRMLYFIANVRIGV